MRKIRQTLVATHLTAALAAGLAGGAVAQTCQFAPVKAQIDTIIDKDKALGEKFRAAFKDGEDSIEALNALVDKTMQAQIDICRFYVAEYLAKRGYPPAH